MEFSFDSFVHGFFDYDPVSQTHTGLWLHEENMDIGGGRISVDNIDRLKDFPDANVVAISGLRQDTFEYFLKTYGRQFKAIRYLRKPTGYEQVRRVKPPVQSLYCSFG